MTVPCGAATAIAQLVNFAGEGLPFLGQRWSSGGAPWHVGRQRATRDTRQFSCCNTVVSEDAGHVIAVLISYLLPDRPAPSVYYELTPMFVRIQQLENSG